MSETSTVAFEYLCGLRMISGRADFIAAGTADGYRDEDAHVFALKIDGVWYWFQEDPQDGYRSSLRFVSCVERAALPKDSVSEFEPIMVSIRIQTDPPTDSYSMQDDLLYGVDERTGLVIFEVGTENLDDYYPSFVCRWSPEGYKPAWLSPKETA